jgi:hypothetical protein
MFGVGKRSSEIGRSIARGAIDASLEGITAPAAKILRKAPASTGARKRKADDRVRRNAIVQARRTTGRTRSQIMTADHDRVAAGLVVAAVSCTPYAPALLEWERHVDRHAQHLGIGERDVFRQRLTLWCERDCATTNAGAAVALALRIALLYFPRMF